MIPQATPPAGYHFRDVQLEMSLKPFWDSSAETCEAVCRELFLQWLPLCRYADSVSLMLWTGDGSEILEYTGDLEFEFEWARYIGSANSIQAEPVADNGDPDHFAVNGHVLGRDPDRRGVHLRSYLYRPEPAKLTFRWLKALVETIKRVGREITGKKIYVGETFDIGPEFAVSRFKYDWHREICGGGALFGGKFIRCDALLNEDDRLYAGFPTGIPAETSVGTFIGRQASHFLRDLGFDFLWFSNGFGFALEPWALTGAIFDGAAFSHEKADETSRRILQFWHDLRAEIPDVPVRTRGTNLTTGIDLGSDASPIREIFRDVSGVDAPVNSPWAALDGDVGLELAGWMSHIARLPGAGYRYRYYIHDPWWLNSPWLDRYQRQPFDIYLPLAVSRLNANGGVEPPQDIAFLSIDDSHGCLPPTVPIEVISHVLHAREFLPDAPAPLIWAYPFDAYHELATGEVKDASLPFFGDWFVRGLITHTVPVNTVADFADIQRLWQNGADVPPGSIILAPVLPDAFGINEHYLHLAESGAKILLYGPLQTAETLCAALEISCESALDGDFELRGEAIETLHSGGKSVRHLPFLSAGGWSEVGGAFGLAVGVQGEQARAACALREFPSGGKLGWIRGSLSTAEYDPGRRNKVLGPRLSELSAEEFFPTEKLARLLLSRMGLGIEVRKTSAADADPMICLHRHRNAFVFSGYQPASACSTTFSMELGAPIFMAGQNFVEGSSMTYSGPSAWHHLCRIFVEQENASQISCRIVPPIQHGYTLRILVSGLKDATLHFLPEPGTEQKLEILRNPHFPYFVGDFVPPIVGQRSGCTVVTVPHADGEVLFSW